MRAARIHRYGPPEVLQVEEVDSPRPRPRDVLIQVRAAAVNPVDTKIRAGSQRGVVRLRLPWILGLDVSGVVAEVGPRVTRFAPGDEVMSSPTHRRPGTYAELVAIDEAQVAPKPSNLTHAEAASLPLVGLTAWQALLDAGRLAAGQRVLIHAGAGGVGSFAIQLATHLGAVVATTCSERNADFVRELGADVVVDYARERFDDVLEPQDVVLDALGAEIKRRSRAVLRRGGRLVSINTGLPANTARWGPNLGALVTGWQMLAFKIGSALRGLRSKDVVRRADGAQLAQIGELAAAGAIRPIVERTYRLEEVAEAHRRIETGRVRGKLVIEVSP